MLHRLIEFFKLKRILFNSFLMIVFGVLSFLLGEVQFSVPNVTGGISDLREIVVLISCFYLPHWIYLVGVSLITSLGTPPDGSLLATITMHIAGVVFVWNSLKYVKEKSIGIYTKGFMWLIIVVIYYLILIPILVVITYFQGLTIGNGIPETLINVSWSLRFEIVITAIATLIYFVFVQIERDLREKVAWLELVIKSANVGFWKRSMSGQEITYHDHWSKMLDYTDNEVQIDYNEWEKLLHPEDKEKTINYLQKCIISGKEKYSHEYRLKAKSGDYKWILDVGKTIKPDGLDKLIQYAGISINITDRKKSEEQLRQAKLKAEESDRLKGEFLAQMSHEIRTPINTMMSFTELVFSEIGDNIPEELKPALSSIQNSGKRLIRTIDLILNVSEINVGNYIKTESIINIHEMIELIIYELKSSNLNDNVSIFLNHEGDKYDTLLDDYSVNQIFYNIIENALKYTERGHVKINILSKSDHILVRVEDTGIGISEEFIPRIFNPFEQEVQGYTRPYEGNGLGMTLVKQYCEINDIDISIKSRRGEGTSIFLNIPIRN